MEIMLFFKGFVGFAFGMLFAMWFLAKIGFPVNSIYAAILGYDPEIKPKHLFYCAVGFFVLWMALSFE